MTRSPLYYAMGRGSAMDSGGDAELQTDVMRFMAILSLCLVAIFALVQSLPVVEKATVMPDPVASEPVEEFLIAEIAELAAANSGTDDALIEKPVTAIEEPVVEPLEVPETPVVNSTPVDPPRVGFTLQFESDETLTRLVSSHDVGFYAIAAGKSMRLGVDGRRLNFWPASMPAQYHEMDGSTVPVDVRRALLRSGSDIAVQPTWGVTLPPRTAKQLQEYLAAASGGALIIGGNGELRMEP